MYLNCKTNFSLRYGTFSTEGLVKSAVAGGIASLALTNINSTADAWDFVKHCHAEKIKPILGAEIRNGDTLLYILIAANNRGVAWINWFISRHLTEKNEETKNMKCPFPETSSSDPFFADIWDGYVIYPSGTKPVNKLFPNEYIGIKPAEIFQLRNYSRQHIDEKVVIRQPVTIQNRNYHNLHRLLRAVDHNVLLTKLNPGAVCGIDESFIAPEKLLDHFSSYPSVVTTTFNLMDHCHIEMDFGVDKTKKLFGQSAQEDKQQLAGLAYDGMLSRYGNCNEEAKKRIEKELQIITDLKFNAYYLRTHDIINYGKSRGYFHVGRGSGANSIVAYCLGITDVDPIELDLFFERFLNPHRNSPPDFDIDFSWADRDDVTEYIFNKYGYDHVALLGVYTTFKHRSIAQELGKVFGLPESERKQLSASGPVKYPAGSLQHTILSYGRHLENFPNYIGIHAGGIIIAEEPIYNYTATHLPPKGFNTSQIDMYFGDDIGLFKLDILSQRGLGHIKDTVQLVRENRGIELNIREVEKFKKDSTLR